MRGSEERRRLRKRVGEEAREEGCMEGFAQGGETQNRPIFPVIPPLAYLSFPFLLIPSTFLSPHHFAFSVQYENHNTQKKDK